MVSVGYPCYGSQPMTYSAIHIDKYRQLIHAVLVVRFDRNLLS